MQDIDGVYVISLERRADRLAAFLSRNRMTLENVHVQEAFDGRELKWNDNLQRLFGNNRFQSRRGLVGQALSHFFLWRHIAQTSDQYHLIMEDDAVLEPGFIERWNGQYHHAFPVDARIIFLGGLTDNNRASYYSGPVLKRVSRHFNLHQNHSFFVHDWDPQLDQGIQGQPSRAFYYKPLAYVLSSVAARELVDLVAAYGFVQPVGVMLMKMMRRWEDVYAIHPLQAAEPPVRFDVANGVDSDIQYDDSPVSGYRTNFEAPATAPVPDRYIPAGSTQASLSPSPPPPLPPPPPPPPPQPAAPLTNVLTQSVAGEPLSTARGALGIVVINLNTSTDRMASFDLAAGRAGLKYGRYPASDGRVLLIDQLRTNGLVGGEFMETKGEGGLQG